MALCQHILELNLDLVSEKAYDAATSYMSVTAGEGFPTEFPIFPLLNLCDPSACHVTFEELFTDVAGAQMDYKGEKRASKWTDDP